MMQCVAAWELTILNFLLRTPRTGLLYSFLKSINNHIFNSTVTNSTYIYLGQGLIYIHIQERENIQKKTLWRNTIIERLIHI
jgi:hypothetical protein